MTGKDRKRGDHATQAQPCTRHADADHGAYKRTGNWKLQFQRDMIALMRAETVQDRREHGTPWKAGYEVASMMLVKKHPTNADKNLGRSGEVQERRWRRIDAFR